MSVKTPDAQPAPYGVYLAAEGFEDKLKAELGPNAWSEGRLFFLPGPAQKAHWAQNIWFDPVLISIASIGEGAQALRDIQRNWHLHSIRHHGRARLIQERLPGISQKPIIFPSPLPKAPMGSWTLLEPNTILAAAHCSSPFADGAPHFAEDKEGPPNRAYLKLWEALTLLDERPGPGDRCLDLGASPGGWTWVLAKLGAEVIAIDKAPLDPKVAAMPGVAWTEGSAFALDPATIGPMDWLFSDVICYPKRLLALVNNWREKGRVGRFVCTLKFQGETDFDTIHAFAQLPGARVLHLSQNKHELTFFCPWPANDPGLS